MAEALKSMFNAEVVRDIAADLPVDQQTFVADCLEGFEPLGLMDRARHIARVMRAHLDPDIGTAIAGLRFPARPGFFFYNPHAFFIQQYGLPAFEHSIAAMYQLTQVFTAEFCIRPFIVHYPQTLDILRDWSCDPSEHVRRLVSEGTRPRLPWAPQLPAFRADPEPVIALLDLLKTDPSDYVQRSVGNNLNDISKDHPDRVLRVARAWAPSPVVQRGLRTLVKAGDPRALRILGFTTTTAAASAELPTSIRIGQRLRLAVRVTTSEPVMVDVGVDFVRSRSTTRKVFKGAVLTSSATVRLTISFEQLSTRRVHPGAHRVVALLNGCEHVLGTVQVLP